MTNVGVLDWGNVAGPPVVFSHGWPLNSDNWENQMFFLANEGYRVIAHDRRGRKLFPPCIPLSIPGANHRKDGRSSQPWDGNDMDTYADDLLQLFVHLDVTNATLIGHSTGGGEVARFLGNHGEEGRVSKAVLVGAITPALGAIETNPGGVPLSVFDGQRQAMIDNRAQLMWDIPSGPFFGFNRPGVNASIGLINSWFVQAMAVGFVNAFECIKAFSETDFIGDLDVINRLKIPVLILHGDDDQLVPVENNAKRAAAMLKKSRLKIYEGGDHALPQTFVHEVNRDILEFLKT